ALAALDASLGDDWQIVPLVKVGRDLASRANGFLRTLRHLTPDTRFIAVPEPNNRVTLRYYSAERRCEQMRGGVPPWTWPELGPQLADLDALYINFISGFELTLETARVLRRGFDRFLCADLHSLFLGTGEDGTRYLQSPPQALEWLACFDTVQVNEEELAQLGGVPLAVAASALARRWTTKCVTLGPRGADYITGIHDRNAR